jgi:hypothetical protein
VWLVDGGHSTGSIGSVNTNLVFKKESLFAAGVMQRSADAAQRRCSEGKFFGGLVVQ